MHSLWSRSLCKSPWHVKRSFHGFKLSDMPSAPVASAGNSHMGILFPLLGNNTIAFSTVLFQLVFFLSGFSSSVFLILCFPESHFYSIRDMLPYALPDALTYTYVNHDKLPGGSWTSILILGSKEGPICSQMFWREA